jgi:hypothetical protein
VYIILVDKLKRKGNFGEKETEGKIMLKFIYRNRMIGCGLNLQYNIGR